MFPQPTSARFQPPPSKNKYTSNQSSSRCQVVALFITALILAGGLLTINALALNGNIALKTIAIINLPVNIAISIAIAATGIGLIVEIPILVTSIMGVLGAATLTAVTVPVLVVSSAAVVASFAALIYTLNQKK